MTGGGGSTPRYGERAAPGPGDYCFRHKDRPSFTLCQRCGRTICPDCQTVSSVGVLCADCVRAALPNASQRAGRSARATVRRLRDGDRPVVTYSIMIACAVMFVAQVLGSWFAGDAVTRALWYAPLYSLPEYFEPWRMFTAMFTHSTGFLLHILFNMYALWLFGPGLERFMGRVWFAVLYVLSGLGGSLFVLLWVYVAPDSREALLTATVGASGAIFGLLAATLVAYRANRVNATSLIVLIAINFVIGLLPGFSISWQAHLGGMVVGALVTWVLLSTRGPRKTNLRRLAMIGIAATLLLASLSFFVVSPISIG